MDRIEKYEKKNIEKFTKYADSWNQNEEVIKSQFNYQIYALYISSKSETVSSLFLLPLFSVGVGSNNITLTSSGA